MKKTVKQHSTTKISLELMEKDKKTARKAKRLIKSSRNQLLNLQKALLNISIIKSNDIHRLALLIDNFKKFTKEILSKIDERIEPEEWNK